MAVACYGFAMVLLKTSAGTVVPLLNLRMVISKRLIKIRGWWCIFIPLRVLRIQHTRMVLRSLNFQTVRYVCFDCYDCDVVVVSLESTNVFFLFCMQTEKHHTDGLKEISFADKTRKIVYPNGDQLSIFPNGSTLKETADGVQVTGTYQEGDAIR